LEVGMLDADMLTDKSPPEIAVEAPGAAVHRTDDRMDVADEAEAADEADAADEVEAADEAADDTDPAEEAEAPAPSSSQFSWSRVLAYAVLPGLALALALGVGYLKWQDGSARLSQQAAAKSVQAAMESTIAMLSYRPETAEKDLIAARDRLTGKFRDDYTKLINDLVIPGAKQKQISSAATVPAAASVSATVNRAVVLVFVNQTIVIGKDPPSDTASCVRLTLDKAGDRWLISQFDPI
jgi:Mce-associated membrane protein